MVFGHALNSITRARLICPHTNWGTVFLLLCSVQHSRSPTQPMHGQKQTPQNTWQQCPNWCAGLPPTLTLALLPRVFIGMFSSLCFGVYHGELTVSAVQQNTMPK